MKDFFFGEIKSDENGASLSLYKIEPLIKKVSDKFFTTQINRLLADNKQMLRIADGTSHPHFDALIDGLTREEIGYIEIYTRSDINNNVKATLACDIVMEQGLISFSPHWCAYKGLRADEIISTLLLPLHLKGWVARTFLRWDDDDVAQPLVSHQDYKQEIQDVFTLAKYPRMADQDSDRSKRTERYALDLKDATEIGEQGLKLEHAWKELDKARKHQGRF